MWHATQLDDDDLWGLAPLVACGGDAGDVDIGDADDDLRIAAGF